ncbi:hypothetical protein NCC78_21370 [Micromonospora phytophila]|uniref:VOC family protein n=1 Tax=Micromonospora phytophila TaxID=709888 RepID=UPI00202E80CE|nr:VOC family protein [Micromonospora phytophila]MCM0677218.1 hypothetical protein [Micromonospora phytophila]
MLPRQPPRRHRAVLLNDTDVKTVKNRAHLDLVPTDSSSRGAEIDRAQQLEATIIDDCRHDLGWAVLADPEGNEFCILND